MKVLSVAEARRLDELAQTRYGIPGYDLMTAAGNSVAESILTEFSPEKVCIVCGKGNNAGDGFVVAQYLHLLACEVGLFCLEEPSAFNGAARQAWDDLSDTVKNARNRPLAECLKDCDVIVDAMLGTGISGAPRGPYADAIRQINASGKPVLSIDVPSGLRELAPGEEPGAIVRASKTITIGLAKSILLTQPGLQFCGTTTADTINFPKELLESSDWRLNWDPVPEMRKWLPPRKPDSNKGTWGHVGIIGSALEYAGATALVARGALRAGCGLATIYALPQTHAIYKTILPEATSVLVGGADDQNMTRAAADAFFVAHRKHTVLTMGPGLGQSDGARAFVPAVLNAWKGPLILDADALNIISDGWQGMLRGRSDCLITPHPGEMARLTGKTVADVQSDRENVARDFAQEYGVTVLLKGAGTIIARPDGQCWLILGAEPALAKGGTGDVLTGIIAGLYAQGIPLWQAAVMGAAMHLEAGRHCAKKFGSRGVLASEIADFVPLLLDAMERGDYT